ncbi:acetyl-CoA hydrolase/transferase family protein [Pusillimonas sp. ANT_WB101]|uniref:acetyl-CoA hydrolase/transferase family protein n=1 Tax=Pusillimonas sp. ANT_WB101 TaxID=2597356 RepID=UPI00165EAD4F|nr:acetyl-CoA hydrolase/transferase C-terminal domain-containing protein [Pusillimonas sp. ANT_WB101]
MVVISDINQLDLAALLRPGDRLVVGQLTAEPVALLQQLCRTHLPSGLTMFIGAHTSGVLHELDGVHLVSYGAMFANAPLVRAGKLAIYPLLYSDLPEAVSNGVFQADVVLMQVAQCSQGGGLFWSAAHDYMADACAKARLVVAVCNRQAPVVMGAAVPVDLRIDYLVHTDTALQTFTAPTAGAIELQIASHVASLIDDGCTLQTGIGSVPDAVLGCLTEHRDLGIHSGVIGDAVQRLIETGVVNNARKSFDAGITVTGSLMGTRRLYEWAHHNSSLRLAPITYTHASSVLCRLHHPVAVNGGLQVDLFGQVNAETAGARYIGGMGGLADFVRGVRKAPRGKSVIGLRSTVRASASAPDQIGISTVVSKLNGPATLGVADADIVVTEWGVAYLRNLSLRERMAAMIAVANPAHREMLSAESRQLAV